MIDRKKLNHQIRAFAHGTLGLDVESYRRVIRDLTPDKEHITDCTTEEALTVLVALKRFRSGQTAGRPPDESVNAPQHRFIARLMDYLKWNWSSTAKFSKRITGKEDTRECSAAELRMVTRGMVAMIEQNIASGRLDLSDTELAVFRHHARFHVPVDILKGSVS